MARSRLVLGSSVSLVLVLSGALAAAPLSVSIEDYTFSFNVDADARYDFAGAAADHLYVPAAAEQHYVEGYVYSGKVPAVPGAPPPSPDPYPVYSGGAPVAFAGNMELDMFFTSNDGPYTNGPDTFQVSLVGNTGGLKITGWLATQGFPPAPLYPAGAPLDITLLEIEFDQVTLLAREGADTADLVEGAGTLKTLLGEDPAALGLPTDGVVYFKFEAPTGSSIFPALAPAVYDPMVDYSLATVQNADILGHTGVPEPASLLLMGAGCAVLLATRRRRRI